MKISHTIRRNFEIALKTAELSEVPFFHHGAMISSGSRVLGLGKNMKVTHPLSSSPWSQHAEFDAIIRLGLNTLQAHKRLVIYSARVAKDGTPRMSKPCSKCMEWIIKAGVKKVVWWDSGSKQIEMMNVKDM